MSLTQTAIAAVSVGMMIACGGGAGTTPIGFWSNHDGAPGVVVFRYNGQPAWDAVDFVFPSALIGISTECSIYVVALDGGIERSDNPAPAQVALLEPMGNEWRLPLDFSDPNGQQAVDQGYRLAHRNTDGGVVDGTVRAEFLGTLSLANGVAKVDYRMEYHDASKLLAVDEGHLTLRRAQTCK